MTNNTPSTPSELFALNEKSTDQKLQAVLREMNLNETLNMVEEVLENLSSYHTSLAEDEEDRHSEKIYEAEANALLDAMMKVRSITRTSDCDS